ncbi:MAG TPA: nitrate reductase [Tepidisphaeraceae bacterium]|jgi:anaerobic selenocysteine-containing dehydrogenase|nr:nitrate reductase [Tepidisphaeraceae bacterium]
MPKSLKTVCPYCGVGCGLLAKSDGAGGITVRGDPHHPANRGKLCLKGATSGLTVNVPNRLRYCMVAEKPGRLRATPIEGAVHHAAHRLNQILQTHGPGAIGFYLSGQLTTESQYFFNKFAKASLRTNHVDSNSRLCMSSAASGMTLSLGSDGPPTCYSDIELADAFFFIGSNAAECHPVTFERVLERMKKKGAPCIVADPRKTATAQAATLHLPVKPGTDLALLNGLLRLLRDRGCLDQRFTESSTEGWRELSALLDDYPATKVAEICGIDCGDLMKAAKILAEHERLITFWTMGVNQSVQGTFTNNAIINLHLATGRIGKPGAGPFSLTGQPNAMGGRDVGYMSHLLPGQRRIADPEHRGQMEEFWRLKSGTIHDEPGYDAISMFDALDCGVLRAIWIVGSNPAATMPNLPKIRRALERAELVIVQDAYLPTETTKFAHVLLPAAVNLEQTGTFCNSERCVSLMQQIVSPPADARPDWWWAQQIANGMGFRSGLSFQNAAEIFDEFARSTVGRANDQSALSHEWLSKHGPTQWPAPASGRAVRRRFTDGRFPTPSGKARLFARPYLPADEVPNAQFPLVLTTGRVHSQWHTRTKTGNVRQLNALSSEPLLEMNPHDAAELGLSDKQRVEIRSRRGRAVSTLAVCSAAPVGTVFLPMHWNDLWCAESSPNEITTDAADPISHQPALKACAVQVAALDAPIQPTSLFPKVEVMQN